MYHAITLAEETYLREKFGAAFDDYCRVVPRWWPRLRGIKETLARTRFNWTRVLVKEYSAPLGWTLPIVLIAIYNVGGGAGFTAQPMATAVLTSAFCAAVALWVIVGLLKKTRSPLLGATK
jgi:protein-S-isoprenylcysteine O-methyltransferase Ste14